MTLFSLVIILSLILITLNVVIAFSLYKRDDISRAQKFYQSILVFVIPFIGAFIVWSFHKSEDTPVSEMKKSNGSSGLDNYTVGGSGID